MLHNITLSVLVLLVAQTLFADAPAFKRSAVESETSAQGCQIDRFSMYSPSMDRDIKVVVVLPPAYEKNHEETFPVLYTLHGYSAPYDTWAKMPKLQKQLAETPFIITCFDGDVASFYIDSPIPVNITRGKKGENVNLQTSLFRTFFFDEFIPAIDEWYRVNPQQRGVTGFSMGGCGALGYMLEHPEMFTAVSGLSSTYFDFSDPEAKSTKWMEGFIGTIDENPEAYKELDYYNIIERRLANGETLPPIYQHIGESDHLLEQNRKFKAFAEEQGLDLTYRESPGKHDYKFWHDGSVDMAKFHWEHFQAAKAE